MTEDQQLIVEAHQVGERGGSHDYSTFGRHYVRQCAGNEVPVECSTVDEQKQSTLDIKLTYPSSKSSSITSLLDSMQSMPPELLLSPIISTKEAILMALNMTK